METLKERLSKCYEELQRLQILPTKQNMSILLVCLNTMQEIYNVMPDKEREEVKAND